MKKNKPPIQIRNNHDHLMVVGRKAIIDLINNPKLLSRVKKISISKSQIQLAQILNQHQINFEYQPKNWFSHKFHDVHHQNCCAELSAKKSLMLDDLIAKTKKETHSLILILDQIIDPHNFGAILRTAAAAKVSGIVVLNKNQAPFNTTVLKVSQGLGLLVDLVVVNNLTNALTKLQAAGFWSYGAILGTRTKPFNQIKYAQKSVLILGNEGRGISSLLAKKTDFQIMIPMAHGVDSLNVAVAAGILIYQIYNNSTKQEPQT